MDYIRAYEIRSKSEQLVFVKVLFKFHKKEYNWHNNCYVIIYNEKYLKGGIYFEKQKIFKRNDS